MLISFVYLNLCVCFRSYPLKIRVGRADYPISIKADHHQPASETLLKYRFAGGPVVAQERMLAELKSIF